MRKRLFLILALLAFLSCIGALSIVWLTFPHGRIDKESYQQIVNEMDLRGEAWMNMQEVEQVLGPAHELETTMVPTPMTSHIWRSESIRIRVFFFGDKAIAIVRSSEKETFLGGMRRWFGMCFAMDKGVTLPSPPPLPIPPTNSPAPPPPHLPAGEHN
jgi:hypothetical protein